jgi:hypothetical protein
LFAPSLNNSLTLGTPIIKFQSEMSTTPSIDIGPTNNIIQSESLYLSVVTAARLWTGQEIVVRFPREARESKTAIGATHPLIDGLPRVPSHGIMRSGHEAEHSPSSNADIKNEWSYTPASWSAQGHYL